MSKHLKHRQTALQIILNQALFECFVHSLIVLQWQSRDMACMVHG